MRLIRSFPVSAERSDMDSSVLAQCIVVVPAWQQFRAILEFSGFRFAISCRILWLQVVFVAFDKAWILGAVLCKLLLYGQIVTLASSTFILTSMSLDRYLAICHPLGSFAVSRSRPRLMIALSWLLAFLFASPQLAIFTQVRIRILLKGRGNAFHMAT